MSFLDPGSSKRGTFQGLLTLGTNHVEDGSAWVDKGRRGRVLGAVRKMGIRLPGCHFET